MQEGMLQVKAKAQAQAQMYLLFFAAKKMMNFWGTQ
jgi:hypothetical protein